MAKAEVVVVNEIVMICHLHSRLCWPMIHFAFILGERFLEAKRPEALVRNGPHRSRLPVRFRWGV